MLFKCRIKIFSLVCILIDLFISSPSFAANFLADCSIQTYNTRHFWNKHSEKKHSFNHFKETELQLYTELSLCSGAILSALGSYASIQDRLNGNTYGFGDVEASCTLQAWGNSSSPWWINLTTIIPAGNEKEDLRYGRWGLEFDLFYSNATNLGPLPFWYYIGVGYRGYFGFPSDQIKAIINTATALTPDIFVYCIGNVEWGLFNGRRQEHFNQILFNPNYRLAAVEIGIVGYLSDNWYVDVGYFHHVWGANVGTGGGFNGGLGLCF